MRLLVEGGHGPGYRVGTEIDYGLIADTGETEAEICTAYARRFRGLALYRGHKAEISVLKSVKNRLARACKLKPDVLVSFHLDGDAGAAPGGRVLWAMSGAEPVAVGVGSALGFPVERVAAEGMLRWNPAIEVRLGNIACWRDLKSLLSSERCDEICNAIIAALEGLIKRPEVCTAS